MKEVIEELTQRIEQLQRSLTEVTQGLINQNPDARDIQAQLVTTRAIKERLEREIETEKNAATE